MRERNPVGMTAETTSVDANTLQSAPTTHEGILSWVNEIAELTQPAQVHWCTGDPHERG